jgi:hypothetical protein
MTQFEQFRNHKNLEVYFDLSFGNVENSYKIDKLVVVLDNKTYGSECTGSQGITSPFVAVTDVRASISCDIEVVQSYQNVQEIPAPFYCIANTVIDGINYPS